MRDIEVFFISLNVFSVATDDPACYFNVFFCTRHAYDLSNEMNSRCYSKHDMIPSVMKFVFVWSCSDALR